MTGKWFPANFEVQWTLHFWLRGPVNSSAQEHFFRDGKPRRKVFGSRCDRWTPRVVRGYEWWLLPPSIGPKAKEAACRGGVLTSSRYLRLVLRSPLNLESFLEQSEAGLKKASANWDGSPNRLRILRGPLCNLDWSSPVCFGLKVATLL